MDEPQTPKKPIDEMLKDLYGPSGDDVSDSSPPPDVLPATPLPGNPQSDSPVTRTPGDVPPADLVDEPVKPTADLWPPVPPIEGADKDQPPWAELTETSTINPITVPAESSPVDINYPKPPVFQTTVVEEPDENHLPPPAIEPTNEAGNVTDKPEVVPSINSQEGQPVPVFTSPLPPRPEPDTVLPDTSAVLPNQPSSANHPAKKSKLFLILPFIAVIMIGIAVLLFMKSRSSIMVGGPINLTYWGLFEPTSVFQQVIADYEKANPKVKINYQQQSGLKEYRDRLTNAINKDSGPDIFRIHLSWVPMFTETLSTIPSSIYSVSDFSQDYYPSAVSALKTPKGLVGLPIYFDSLALFYNDDLFRAAGQNPPATWEDLIKSACTLTVRDQNGRIKTGGVALGTSVNVDHWSDILGLMLLQNGADLVSPTTCDDRGVCPGRDALTFFTNFVKNSACRNNDGAYLGSSWSDLLPSSTYAFATGQVAMYFAPSWRVFDIKYLNPNLNFKVVPVPQLSTDTQDKVAWATYWVESVSAKSPNQTEAWKFLKYLSGKEVLEKLYLAQTNLGGPRIFGEPYPRQDMASMLTGDPWVGPFVTQGSYAKNWYLSSFTSDNGINDQIIKYYEDAVNKSVLGQDSAEVLETVTQGVAQILSRYGVQTTVQ